MVLPGTDAADAVHRANSVRERIQSLSIRYGGKTLPTVTISIGVAGYPEAGSSPHDIKRAAEGAQYAAKAQGRKRVVLARMVEDEKPDTAMHVPILTAAE